MSAPARLPRAAGAEANVLKIFGAVTWLLGIGGLMYAAANAGDSVGSSTGPSWFYSSY